MTDTNPFIVAREQAKQQSQYVSLEGGTVITAPNHQSGDLNKHTVKVSPIGRDTDFIAEVLPNTFGDAYVPPEGTSVLLGRRRDGNYVVLSDRYQADDTVPEYKAGERHIGHPLTDALISIEEDGTVTVTSDSGTTVTISDKVIVNGGSTPIVTGVNTSTDVDGHVTDISLETSSDILVP